MPATKSEALLGQGGSCLTFGPGSGSSAGRSTSMPGGSPGVKSRRKRDGTCWAAWGGGFGTDRARRHFIAADSRIRQRSGPPPARRGNICTGRDGRRENHNPNCEQMGTPVRVPAHTHADSLPATVQVCRWRGRCQGKKAPFSRDSRVGGIPDALARRVALPEDESRPWRRSTPAASALRGCTERQSRTRGSRPRHPTVCRNASVHCGATGRHYALRRRLSAVQSQVDDQRRNESAGGLVSGMSPLLRRLQP